MDAVAVVVHDVWSMRTRGDGGGDEAIPVVGGSLATHRRCAFWGTARSLRADLLDGSDPNEARYAHLRQGIGHACLRAVSETLRAGWVSARAPQRTRMSLSQWGYVGFVTPERFVELDHLRMARRPRDGSST